MACIALLEDKGLARNYQNELACDDRRAAFSGARFSGTLIPIPHCARKSYEQTVAHPSPYRKVISHAISKPCTTNATSQNTTPPHPTTSYTRNRKPLARHQSTVLASSAGPLSPRKYQQCSYQDRSTPLSPPPSSPHTQTPHPPHHHLTNAPPPFTFPPLHQNSNPTSRDTISFYQPRLLSKTKVKVEVIVGSSD